MAQTPKGLGKFDRNTRKFLNTFYPFNYSEVFDDQEGNILISPNVGGLYKLNRNNHWVCYLDSAKGSYSDRIVALYPAKNSKLWIGNLTGDLYLFDQKTNSKKWITNIKSALTAICEDSYGTVWFGGIATGLFCYDMKTDSVIQYSSILNDPTTISDNSILTLFEDHTRSLWIGTNKGLNTYNPQNHTFYRFTGKDAFLANAVMHILEDGHSNLWISTRNGIAKFNLNSRQSINYYSSSHFAGIEFYRRVGCRTKDAKMYFGGVKGFISFHPDSIKLTEFVPPIVITSFRKFEKSFSFGSEVKLTHDDNFISFEFAALSFVNSKENQYAYKMEGLDKDWIYCGTRHYTSYPNIEPGEYIFRVKGSNNDGVWNEQGAALKIIILPPWWKTKWAYFFYFALIVGIIYLIWRLQLKRIQTKHEFDISKFEAKKLHEVDEMKSRFFTNISHEFRTPLTLILGPVKEMIERTNDSRSKEELNLVHRNAKRLLNLVNQLLDISKLESGSMNLHTVPTNLVILLKALTLSFTSYAERKRIQLNFISDSNEITAYIDKDKMENIFTNVMSNAFKFTPDGGKINVAIKCQAELVSPRGVLWTASSMQSENSKPNEIPKQIRDDQYRFVEISIHDTGIGISRDKLPKIFDRFYQVDSSHTRENEGTGIGLSLTKELVELHKGTIEVVSEEGRGTVVTVRIPLGKAHLKPEEIFENEIEHLSEKPIAQIEEVYADEDGIKSDKEFTELQSLPLLLIVEDNFDVRNYIKNILQKEYAIVEAKDGDDGWNKSVEQIPDLIISDIMMPKMDGFKLCDKLKTDERTSHIPVILLTAKATKHDKIDGFELGADDYIMKPFETDELTARVKNLITQRKRLHEHFKNTGLLDFESTQITSVDKKFLQKTLEIIKQHISDTAFNVESLSEYLSVSKSVLQKKISALTGHTPIEFIRRIRLKKAVELIEKKFGNMSEIALEIGFGNPAYFSEMFKKEFGMTPKEYQQKIKKN